MSEKIRKKVKLKTTSEILRAKEFLNTLHANLPKIVSQSIWKQKVSISEKIEYIRVISSARSSLIRIAEHKYPQLSGKDYSIGNVYIEYDKNEEDELCPECGENCGTEGCTKEEREHIAQVDADERKDV